MNTVINEFLKQYPEYDNDKYYVELYERARYGGDYEIVVYSTINPKYKREYVCTYWCKLCNSDEAEKIYQFELEKEINIMKVSFNIGSLVDKFIHYDCKIVMNQIIRMLLRKKLLKHGGRIMNKKYVRRLQEKY